MADGVVEAVVERAAFAADGVVEDEDAGSGGAGDAGGGVVAVVGYDVDGDVRGGLGEDALDAVGDEAMLVMRGDDDGERKGGGGDGLAALAGEGCDRGEDEEVEDEREGVEEEDDAEGEPDGMKRQGWHK